MINFVMNAFILGWLMVNFQQESSFEELSPYKAVRGEMIDELTNPATTFRAGRRPSQPRAAAQRPPNFETGKTTNLPHSYPLSKKYLVECFPRFFTTLFVSPFVLYWLKTHAKLAIKTRLLARTLYPRGLFKSFCGLGLSCCCLAIGS